MDGFRDFFNISKGDDMGNDTSDSCDDDVEASAILVGREIAKLSQRPLLTLATRGECCACALQAPQAEGCGCGRE